MVDLKKLEKRLDEALAQETKESLLNCINFNSNDMFWNISVVDTGKLNGNEPILELQWGWTAGLEPDLIKEIESCEDNPTGYESVKILLTQAQSLRDDLDKMICKWQKQF